MSGRQAFKLGALHASIAGSGRNPQPAQAPAALHLQYAHARSGAERNPHQRAPNGNPWVTFSGEKVTPPHSGKPIDAVLQANLFQRRGIKLKHKNHPVSG